MNRTARFNDSKNPLVSIVLHSNNSEKYLRQCLNSILNQTYDNIEIIFYDYASSDNSWSIAVEYQSKYSGLITLLRIRKDYTLDGLVNHLQNVRGKYFIRFRANCEIRPTLIEKCVSSFKSYHDVAFVKIRKVFVDNLSNEILEPALYEKSCIIPGIEHVANYLTLNPKLNSSISMFNTDIAKINNKLSGRTYNDSYIEEAELCLKYNIAYLSEPLLIYRENESISIPGESNYLTEILNQYLTKVDFIKNLLFIYESNGITENLTKIISRISDLCLVNSINALEVNDEITAKKFFYLSAVIDLNYEKTEGFLKLKKYWETDINSRGELLNEIKSLKNQFEKRDLFALPKGGFFIGNNY